MVARLLCHEDKNGIVVHINSNGIVSLSSMLPEAENIDFEHFFVALTASGRYSTALLDEQCRHVPSTEQRVDMIYTKIVHSIRRSIFTASYILEVQTHQSLASSTQRLARLNAQLAKH